MDAGFHISLYTGKYLSNDEIKHTTFYTPFPVTMSYFYTTNKPNVFINRPYGTYGMYKA